MNRVHAFALGAILALTTLVADTQTIVLIDAIPTPSGVVSSKFRDGDDGSGGIPLSWAVIGPFTNIVEGDTPCFDLRTYLTEPGSPDATLSLVGSVANWSLSTDDLCYDGSGISSGTLIARASRSGFTSDSLSFAVSSVAAASVQCISGHTCAATEGATCVFEDLSGDQRITASGPGQCVSYKTFGSESNRHFAINVLNTASWNDKPFAGGGIFFSRTGINFPTDYQSLVYWPQDTKVRLRTNHYGTALDQANTAVTSLPQFIGFEYEASTDEQSGWESEAGTTFIQLGAAVDDGAFNTGAYGLFVKSNNGTAVSMTFDVVADNTTLSFGPVGPPPPTNETSAIIARISHVPGGPPWASGMGQPINGFPASINAWEAWIGYEPDIMTVWDSTKCLTTWAEWESGNGCGFFQDITSADSGFPDNRTLIISRPLWPREYANLGAGSGCPAAQVSAWQDAANGALDAHYHTWADNFKVKLAAVGRNTSSIMIRLGWESTGTWYPWSICQQHQNFRITWNRVVQILRDELPGVLIDFPPSPRYPSGNSPRCDLACLVQGNGVTLDFDVLTMSHHDATPTTTSVAVFNNRYYDNPNDTFIDLVELRDVAIAYDRPFGFDEWGTSTGTVQECPDAGFPPNPNFGWIFIEQTYNFLTEPESVGRVSHDTYFSTSCNNVHTRPGHASSQMFHQLWTQ